MQTIEIQGYDSTEIIDVSTGYIARKRDGKLFVTGSDSWVCTGAVILNNFGHITKRLSVRDLFETLKTDKASLFCKNGKPKFRISDIDHGTHRIWSNPVIKHYQIRPFWISA